MNLKHHARTGALALVIVGAGAFMPSPALGDEPNSEGRGSESATPTRTQIEVRYEHPIRLDDAIAATAPLYPEALAYRFENSQVVGEYSPQSGTSPAEFMESFDSRMGTQPEVVAFVLPVDEQDDLSPVVAPDVSDIPVFRAPPIPEATSDRLSRGADTQIADANRMSSTSDWRPDLVQTRVEDYGSVFFEYALFWDSPTSPGYIPLDYGMEVGVDLYNNAGTNLRPACPPGYKDAFFAKNYGWNWFAFNETFGAVASAQPYADYNDLLDECNRNSIQVGFASPQAIPLSYNNAPYDWVLFISVQAPKGNMSSNPISGNVALVTKNWCTSYPSYSWTDCMGVSSSGSPIVNQNRGFLASSRGWTAPNKCWTSDQKGTVAPVLTLPTATGCF